jgi:hypothetical protein
MDQHPQEEGVPARTEEEPAIVWDFARPILVSRFFLGGVHSPACLRAAPTCFVKRLNFEGQIFVQRLYFEVWIFWSANILKRRKDFETPIDDKFPIM